VNTFALVAVPAGVVTLIGPVVAPAGTSALIVMSETTKKRVLGAVLKRTSVAPVKFVPWMVTVPPARPPSGAKLVIVGGLAAAPIVA
jgi:hypothetical protein